MERSLKTEQNHTSTKNDEETLVVGEGGEESMSTGEHQEE